MGVAPTTATHQTGCENPAIGWAGQTKTSTQNKDIEGISGNFEGESLDPCYGGVGSSWLWVAIEGDCSWCLLQIGMGRGASTETMGWYRAWGRDSSAPGCSGYSNVEPLTTRISTWSGSAETYKIVLDGSLWSFRINGVERSALADFQVCWRNYIAAWFGEAYNRGSAIGGSTTNHHQVSASRYRVAGDQTWYSPGWNAGTLCAIENPKPPYHCMKVGSSAIDMWTHHGGT